MAKDKAKLSDVREQKRNSNRHTVRGSGMLEHSIRKNGVISAITTANNLETFDGSNTLANCLDIFGDEVEPIFVYSDGSRPVVHVRTDIETADDPRAVELGVAANRVAYVDYDPDIELLLEIDEEIGLGDLYFEDELAALVEADRNESEEYLENTDRATNPKEDEEAYLNSSVRQFVLTYSVDEYDLVLGFFELLMNRFNVGNNTDALKALAENYE